MNTSKLTRSEKGDLYIKKQTELQTIWENPIDTDWEFVKEMTDEELDKALADTSGQVKFEKATGFIGKAVYILVAVFVALGIAGLLLFGIKQLF